MTQTATITDQARLALFLLPWRKEIANGPAISSEVAIEILDYAYHMSGAWAFDGKVSFGNAYIIVSSWANTAPCSPDTRTKYNANTSEYVDAYRAISWPHFLSDEERELAWSVAIEMLHLAGPMASASEVEERHEKAKGYICEKKSALFALGKAKNRIEYIKFIPAEYELREARAKAIPVARELALAKLAQSVVEHLL